MSSPFATLQRTFRSSLFRDAGTAFVIQALGVVLGYGMHVALARWMGSTQYGVYVYVLSWITLLATLGGLGLPTAVLRFIPTYRHDGTFGLLRGLLKQSRRFALAGATTLAAVASILFLTLPVALSFPRWILIAGLWLVPLLALLLLETAILRACRRMAFAYAPLHLLRRLLIVGGAGLIVVYSIPLSAPTVLALCGGAFALSWLVQRLASAFLLGPHLSHPPRWQTRSWLMVALPLLLSKGLALLINKTDIFVIGALMAPEHVGTYNAALQTAHTVTFLGIAVDAVAAPVISDLHARGDRQALQALAARLAHWYFWPTLGLAVGIGVFAAPILSLFGPSFPDSRPVVLILMLGLVTNAGMGMHLYLLKLTGLERACAYIYGSCALLNVGLNIAGVALLGTIGAACATAITLIVLSTWMHHTVVTRLGIRPSILHALS